MTSPTLEHAPEVFLRLQLDNDYSLLMADIALGAKITRPLRQEGSNPILRFSRRGGRDGMGGSILLLGVPPA
jgi:hypothetical protein